MPQGGVSSALPFVYGVPMEPSALISQSPEAGKVGKGFRRRSVRTVGNPAGVLPEHEPVAEGPIVESGEARGDSAPEEPLLVEVVVLVSPHGRRRAEVVGGVLAVPEMVSPQL